MPIHELGKGAVKRPDLMAHMILGAEEIGAVAPDFTKPTGLQEPPDEDQGSSSSCTSQAHGYYLWQLTGIEASRNDPYSHTHLPGGGAYLNAPGQFHQKNGTLLRGSKYPDPTPETEANMEQVILSINESGRIRTFSFDILNIQVNINTIGGVLEQYKGCIIGVDGNNDGWIYSNITDPTYNGKADWGHALYVYDRAIRNGKKALKAKSSWCNEVKNHFINEDYFNNGGVFEALVYANFKETTMPQVKSANIKGEEGIFLAAATPEEFQALCNVFGKDPNNVEVTA